MTDLATHPSNEDLHAYSLGQLPEDQAVAIDDHISSCEPCCETIVSFSSDDTFVGLLQDARQSPTDQTVDLPQDRTATTSSSGSDVPPALADHPRYEILGLIGKGGMGDVYKARHRMMKRTVALKVIKQELVRKREAVDRFHREVTTAGQLTHPNIVTSHDAEQAGDVHYLVMEYVDGVDLANTVKRQGALPIADACDYIRQAAIGLQYAHEQGMVHRDIKPHNLMVTDDGTVKILDFGLASLAPEVQVDEETVEVRGDLTAAGAIMGTPDFISPEQAEDAHSADIRSDIYSLGSTLYFLLSGQAPFHDGSVMHKLKSHAQAEPQPLRSLREDVPPELVAVVEKMTAKNPEERYLTPSEVADALESFLREWRSDGAKSPVHEASGDGNMSDSGGQKSGAGDMNPDWLARLATWLYYISLVPVALLVIDVFSSDETDGSSPDLVWYYMLASICLSSIAAVVTGIQKSRSGPVDISDRRISRMSASDFGLITAVLLVAGICYFSDSWTDSPEHFISGGAGVGGDDWYVTSGGTYLVEDEPGVLFGMVEAPNGDRSLSYVVLFLHDRSELTQASSAQNASLQFDGRSATIRDGISIDGKTFEINLKMEMEAQDITSIRININGESIDPSMGRLFLVDLTSGDVAWNQLDRAFPKNLPAPSDVVSDTELVSRVAKQVTDQLATDDDRVRSFLTGKTATTSRASISEVTSAQPELRITGKILNRGTAGLPNVWDWDLSGRDVGDLKVRLLLAQNGKSDVVQEFDFEELPADFTSKVRLQVSDAATGADRKKRVTAILNMESPVNSRCTTTNEDKQLSINVEAPFSNSLDVSNVKPISPGETELLVARMYWKGDMTHDTSMESMIEATKDGNATFLFVTLFWTSTGDSEANGADPRSVSNAEDDRRSIQGTWQVTHSEDSGRIAPQEMLKSLRFTFANGKLTTAIGGRMTTATYRLNPSADPGTIDLIEGDRTRRGIYELLGDSLRICLSEDQNGARPTGFESKPDSVNDLLIQLKRIDAIVASQISALENALKLYRLDTLTYPSTEDGLASLRRKPSDENLALNWKGPYRKELPVDPWGNAFQYRFPGARGDESQPDIWSRGPDGESGTDDDIGNWKSPVKSAAAIGVDAGNRHNELDVRQILDRMEKAYVECKSYRDSGVIKSAFFTNAGSPELTAEHSFTTAFVRPDRFRFEIKDEDAERLLIAANGQDVQTWWDLEPGVKKTESMEFAMARAAGFTGGDVGRIPALLMPQKLEISGGLDLIDPKRIEDGKLQNVECFRLEYNFRDEQFTLWIDRQSYLVRRIDERIKADSMRIERTTTYDSAIDGEITDGMLEFDPPSPRAADDRATPDGELKQLPGDQVSDHGSIQGAWQVVHYADNGRVEPLPFALKMKLAFADNLLTFTMEEGREEISSFKLDPSKTPKSIDLTNGDQVILGIYELRDDQLRICLTQGRKGARPITFDSKPDTTSNILIVAERPRSSAVSPGIVAMLDKSGQSEEGFKKKLHTTICRAAGIPNAQWEKLAKAQTSINPALVIEGEPLSIVLLMNAPHGGNSDEFEAFRLLTERSPMPQELHDAMSLSQEHGYVSVIQPTYIKSTTVDIDADSKLLRGTVAFEAPNLYSGRVNFAVQYHGGRMKVVEFTIPSYLTIALNDDDVWCRKSVERHPKTDVDDGGVVQNADRDKAEAYFDALGKVQSVDEEEKLLKKFADWLRKKGYTLRVEEKNGKHVLSCPCFPPVTPWTDHKFLDVKNLDLLPRLDDR